MNFSLPGTTRLSKSQLRLLWRARWSLVSAFVGVSLGVASVVAVHRIGVAVEGSLATATPPHLAGVSHVLHKPNVSMKDYFELRGRWRAGEFPQVRNLLPVLEEALLLPTDESRVEPRRISLVATDWFGTGPGTQPGPMGATSGRSFHIDGVVADASLGMAVGQRLAFNGSSLEVVGIVRTGTGPTFFVDLGTAHRLLELDPDALTLVVADLHDPFATARRVVDALLPGFSAGLPLWPAPWQLSEWSVQSVRSEMPSAEFSRSVLFNLGALGSLALLVAALLIYQVAVIWLRRRRPLMDRLYLLGVSRAELMRGFLASMVMLGSAATVTGLLVGLPLAELLLALSSNAVTRGDSDPAGGVEAWQLVVLAKALVAGLGISMLGGWLAFAREWPNRGAGGRGRAVVRPMIVLVLVLLAYLGSRWSASGLIGGFAAVLAVCLLVTVAVRPLLDVFRRHSRRLRGRLILRASLRELGWYPRELSVALGAMSLAVATSIGVGLMVESFRVDFERMLGQRLAGELYVSGPPGRVLDAASWLTERPDVARLSMTGTLPARVSGVPVRLGYGRFDEVEARRYGHDAALTERQTLISERLARQLGVGVDDEVELGTRRLTVANIFAGFGEPVPRLLVHDTTVEALGFSLLHDRLSVYGSDSGSGFGAESLAVELAERFPTLQVQLRGSIRQRSLEIFDNTFAITQAMTLLAMLVALIGLYNSLTALRINQQPSARLLVALGVSWSERRWLDITRALGVGTVAVVLALPLGVMMAWLLCTVINPRAFGWSIELTVSAWEICGPVALGLMAACLAGVLPIPEEDAGAVS